MNLNLPISTTGLCLYEVLTLGELWKNTPTPCYLCNCSRSLKFHDQELSYYYGYYPQISLAHPFPPMLPIILPLPPDNALPSTLHAYSNPIHSRPSHNSLLLKEVLPPPHCSTPTCCFHKTSVMEYLRSSRDPRVMLYC